MSWPPRVRPSHTTGAASAQTLWKATVTKSSSIVASIWQCEDLQPRLLHHGSAPRELGAIVQDPRDARSLRPRAARALQSPIRGRAWCQAVALSLRVPVPGLYSYRYTYKKGSQAIHALGSPALEAPAAQGSSSLISPGGAVLVRMGFVSLEVIFQSPTARSGGAPGPSRCGLCCV